MRRRNHEQPRWPASLAQVDLQHAWVDGHLTKDQGRARPWVMKLYFVHRCPYGHRATTVLREKGLAFEPIFFTAGNRPTELSQMGPNARSPTLIDGDVAVWDSQIVIAYLDERYPETPLMPASAARRAEARMTMALVTNELAPHAGAVAVELLHKKERDQEKIDAGRQAFTQALPAWDRRLQGREFLVGDRLSLADVTLFTLFPGIHGMIGLEIPAELGHLRAWYDLMAARPSTALLHPS